MKKSIIALAATTILSTGYIGSASAQSYKVERGDNLWNIAREHHTTVEQLKDWNGIASDIIYPNQVLTVSAEPIYYQIQKGDTLSKIARMHGVSVQNLKAMNQLTSDLIYAGNRLIVAGGSVNQTVTEPAPQINESNKVKEPVNNPSSQASESAHTEQPAQPAVEAVEETPTPVPAQPAPQQEASANTNGNEFTVTATAYTAECDGCSGTTATGINLKSNPNAKIIAVDPNVIPLGSKVYVEGYGEAIAGDTGGAIKGNKIDIFVPSEDQARNWGVRTVKVKVLQ
ncbi:3D (Asp-Asp-Asp) domain-containing protein/LysM repeat protein [Oikeobacillus pervagus]|uniref:3D (Asp-Asp-Asp) domain-containing protein/LysM repeat protein n=1 Tax=Oikeobacillus pervagus TaxID=1325931 RepID=A0AAJ1SYS8_9BACI|nr:LysM peptidoglycan-binding and 3D domain-containing protein [Oikeobacillus pervagus]MDQ0215299.1 3D (Asp-Asp-Asp) domain-containing protein/LysM repeat protein [Oikeobacillus pervagus]